MEMKVTTEDLTHGMYVCRLDRPWLGTPFLLQGFYIQCDKDLQLLRDHCEHVYVDTDSRQQPSAHRQRHSDIVRQPRNGTATLSRATVSSQPATRNNQRPHNGTHLKPGTAYPDKRPVEEEIEVATALRTEVSKVVDEMMQNVQDGKKFDIHSVKAAVKKILESILRNPDAFIGLRSLKDKATYTHAHCMDSSALAIAFGRTMGFSRHHLDELGMGALMFDVGKMRVPKELINKPDRLTEREFKLVKQHVTHSVRIMEETGALSRESIAVAATHHERFDGSGYPRGLKAGKIPVLGRMAGIVDCYDAITSDTPYRRAISAHEAVRKLYGWRGSLFQDALVEQFIQTLGTYPTGSIVELTTGQVGIVISQNRVRRLKPKVMLVLDAEKNRYGAAPIVDLVKETEDAEGNPPEILKALEPGTYGIEPTEFYL